MTRVRLTVFLVVVMAFLLVLTTALIHNNPEESGLDDWLFEQIINDQPRTLAQSAAEIANHRKLLEAHGYVHSKFFDANGQLNVPTLGEMQLAARLSGAAYCVSRNAQALADWVCKSCPTSIKMENNVVVNMDGYQLGFYIGYDATNNKIRIVFRGSSNFSNWMANLAFAKVALGPGKGEVHTGFRTAYLQARAAIVNKVTALRSQHPTAPVQITGHSLGGAVALLCALDFKSGLSITTLTDGLTHVSSELFPEPMPFTQGQLQSLGAITTTQSFPLAGPIITFGQPRLGDSIFAYWAATTLASEGYFRITHRFDPVPRLPTQAMGFLHANPQEIYFYEQESINYKVCAGGASEDKSCIIGPVLNLSLSDHSFYAAVFLTQTDETCARR